MTFRETLDSVAPVCYADLAVKNRAAVTESQQIRGTCPLIVAAVTGHCGRVPILEAPMPEPETDSLPFDVQPWDALIAAEELLVADLTERLEDAKRILASDRERREIAIANGT